jgi:hypothetical protein
MKHYFLGEDCLSQIGPSRFLLLIFCSLWFVSWLPCAAQVAVRHAEGLSHGFLVLRNQEGETIAHGELLQTSHASRATTRLVFHFKDGSLYDETAVYSQSHDFRLLRYSLTEKGSSFSHPQNLSFDVTSGNVTVQYTGDDGKQQTKSEYMKLPPDLANGMIPVLLKNVPPGGTEVNASMLVATPKPRLVRLAISQQGEDTFLFGSEKREATHYVVKIKLQGITGVLAEVLGKQPPDIHTWILGGVAPAFLKSSGPIYAGGPIWQIELASPSWPSNEEDKKAGSSHRRLCRPLQSYLPVAFPPAGRFWNSWFIQLLKASSDCGRPRKLFTRSLAGIEPVLSSTVER